MTHTKQGMFEHYGPADDYVANAGCYTCNDPNDLYSTGVQIEGEGILTFCRSCINVLASLAGVSNRPWTTSRGGHELERVAGRDAAYLS